MSLSDILNKYPPEEEELRIIQHQVSDTTNNAESAEKIIEIDQVSDTTKNADAKTEEEQEGLVEVQKIDKTRWKPWQDRALVRQVLADDPFGCVRGESSKKWQKVAKHLLQLNPPVQRSDIACRSRCLQLIKVHKAEESLSLQKTGTDEEVSQYTRDMDEVVVRSDEQARDPEVKAAAKKRLAEMEEAGKEIRDGAMKGMIDLETRSQEKSQRKRLKIAEELQQLKEISNHLDILDNKEKEKLGRLEQEAREMNTKLLEASESSNM